MQAAGECHSVVQKMVVAQEHGPFAAMTAIPATQGQGHGISPTPFAATISGAPLAAMAAVPAPRRHSQGSAPVDCLVLSRKSYSPFAAWQEPSWRHGQ